MMKLPGVKLSTFFDFIGLIVGQLIPILYVFEQKIPPFFKEAVFFIYCGIVILLCLVFILTKQVTKETIRGMLALCLILSGLYFYLFDCSTYYFRQQDERVQIGFGMWKSGLTDHALGLMKEYPKADNDFEPKDLIDFSGQKPGNETDMWKKSSIEASCFLLSVIYFLTIITWSIQWCFLMILVLKDHKEKDPIKLGL